MDGHVLEAHVVDDRVEGRPDRGGVVGRLEGLDEGREPRLAFDEDQLAVREPRMREAQHTPHRGAQIRHQFDAVPVDDRPPVGIVEGDVPRDDSVEMERFDPADLESAEDQRAHQRVGREAGGLARDGSIEMNEDAEGERERRHDHPEQPTNRARDATPSRGSLVLERRVDVRRVVVLVRVHQNASPMVRWTAPWKRANPKLTSWLGAGSSWPMICARGTSHPMSKRKGPMIVWYRSPRPTAR